MAHIYRGQPFYEQPRQPPSTPHYLAPRDFFNGALPSLPPRPMSQLERDRLDEELTRNVEREFPSWSGQAALSSADGPSAPTVVEEEPMDEALTQSPLSSSRGYMQRSSPFSLDYQHTDMSFLEWFPRGNATLTYLNENHDLESIPHLDPSYFEERCPLLAYAFEPSRNGPQLYLEILTPATAKPFLRYLYTGSYAIPGRESDNIYEDVPTSLLLHCQLFRLGDVYDLPDLKQQAYVNVTRQCEFGCSSPDKPIDLCEAIRYMYQHLGEHANLIETLICYCVTCFLKHRLDDDFGFRTMAFDLRQFQQDLIRESMKREFEDESASAIVNLPFKPFIPETYASREDITPGRGDVIYHFHASDEFETSPKKRKRQTIVTPKRSAITLALRQKCKAQDEVAQADRLGDPDIGSSSKRRASMVKHEAATSDSDFEIIAGPAPVLELSTDTESDVDEPVVVGHPGLSSDHQSRTLPIRRRSAVSSMTLVETTPDGAHDDVFDGGSESDWTLI